MADNDFHRADPAWYPLLKENAKQMRKEPTEAEEYLWRQLKGGELGVEFKRQCIIGDYIADFLAPKFGLIIEVDGGYHQDDEQQVLDEWRTSWLEGRGYHIERFQNEQVLFDTDAVTAQIKKYIMDNKEHTQAQPHPSHLWEGQGERGQHSSSQAQPHPSHLGEGQGERGFQALCVDAACSGNPGPMEYRGVHLPSGKQVFHFGPIQGTNNIGEFLAIVHALALMKQKGIIMPIYSDSKTGQTWVRNMKAKTTLARTEETAQALDLVARAENWLKTNSFRVPINKWNTEEWGEIPADFGRK